MPSPFTQFAASLDALTQARMGERVQINGLPYCAVPATSPALFGAVEAELTTLMIFSAAYRPQRDDEVVWQGAEYRVARYHRQNGKYVIQLEPQ
ncbi:hypothetical protein [Edwardsiella tarda]|uniref:hypothetical protein n=1 Tax=Edwardsiella tarda TaxID=636 RepID=UPI00083B3C25|nr:hypothetical protein [Edwardsiella tarda]